MATRILIILTVASALFAADNKVAKIDSDKHPSGNYNIPLWEAGKVPLAKGDGPLDAPFLTVFSSRRGQSQWRLRRGRAGRVEHHADVWRRRYRYR